MTLARRGTYGPQLPALVDVHPVRANTLDAFSRAVPEAGFDVCMLFHHARNTPAIDRFQILLRGLCALKRQVTRAAMMDDRIEVQIDASRIVLGHMHPDDLLPMSRPDFAAAHFHSGRLAYLLAHHDLALRLRIDSMANDLLITEIACLAMGPHPPRAMILLDRHIMLTLQEFKARDPAALRNLAPGQSLATLRARYARPRNTDTRPTPSPFTHQAEPAHTSDPRRRVFARLSALDSPAGEKSDPIDRMVSDFCDKRAADGLATAFRRPDRKAPGAYRTSEKTGAAFCAAHGNGKNSLLCDAVIIGQRGRKTVHLASILLATLVQFAQVDEAHSLRLADVPQRGEISGMAAQTRYSV